MNVNEITDLKIVLSFQTASSIINNKLDDQPYKWLAIFKSNTSLKGHTIDHLCNFKKSIDECCLFLNEQNIRHF